MAKATAAQCHAMTTHFVSAVEFETGNAPVVNRNKARWGFEAILMDYSTKETKDLVSFYVSNYTKPSLEWFLYNYDQVVELKKDKEKEAEQRQQRRMETQQRLDVWKEKFAK